MKSFAIAAFAAVALANPMPQAVTSAIAPSGSAPAGCQASVSGSYEITVVKPSTPAKRDLEKRAACGGEGTLVVTLNNGVMLDAQGRQAYIASNNQFQFDAPPQAGAIYTSGFSVCGNSSVALGGSTVFYQCLSGSFYNLYNTNWAPQCSPVAMNVISCETGGSTATASNPIATQSADGQPGGPSAVTQLSDAQPNGPSASVVPVTQISDAQPQGPSATAIPLSQISDGQPQMPSALLSQLSDAQPVATGTGAVPTGAPNATLATPSPSASPFTGGASLPIIGEMAAVAGGLAVIALL